MPRVARLLPAALWLGVHAAHAQRPSRPQPRVLVAQAAAAVDGGRADSLAQAWRASAGSGAALVLATLDRLAYRYAAADSAYVTLAALTPTGDPLGTYARLGRAEGLLARGLVVAADSAFQAAAGAARATRDSLALAESLSGAAVARLFVAGAAASAAILDSAARALPRDTPARDLAVAR